MISPTAVRDTLRHHLTLPLPGRAAQRVAWPDHLPSRASPEDEESYAHAGVLLAICPQGGDRFAIPLMKRPDGDLRHAGQISLPGGQLEAGEEITSCALREAEEEIGLAASTVEVLGLLTPVPVPVSRYRVHPVVGWCNAPPPVWTPQPGEVDAVFEADPDQLMREGPRGVVTRTREGRRVDAPAYVVPHEDTQALVWGATAIILSEFLAIWRKPR